MKNLDWHVENAFDINKGLGRAIDINKGLGRAKTPTITLLGTPRSGKTIGIEGTGKSLLGSLFLHKALLSAIPTTDLYKYLCEKEYSQQQINQILLAQNNTDLKLIDFNIEMSVEEMRQLRINNTKSPD